jgi:hypothetical protein
MNETELPAMAHPDCLPELTTYLTLRPFLHLGPRIAGAQAQSRCRPPRRNDLDAAEHRHTIKTAGTAARPNHTGTPTMSTR